MTPRFIILIGAINPVKIHLNSSHVVAMIWDVDKKHNEITVTNGDVLLVKETPDAILAKIG